MYAFSRKELALSRCDLNNMRYSSDYDGREPFSTVVVAAEPVRASSKFVSGFAAKFTGHALYVDLAQPQKEVFAYTKASDNIGRRLALFELKGRDSAGEVFRLSERTVTLLQPKEEAVLMRYPIAVLEQIKVYNTDYAQLMHRIWDDTVFGIKPDGTVDSLTGFLAPFPDVTMALFEDGYVAIPSFVKGDVAYVC